MFFRKQKDRQLTCSLHPDKPLMFICKFAACNYTPLCEICRKTHLSKSKYDVHAHIAQIITINKAFEQAEINLVRNKNMLKSLVDPFHKEKQIFDKIEVEKQKLTQERDRIIRAINERFAEQINLLVSQNKEVILKNKNTVPFEQITQRISQVEKLESQFKKDEGKLRRALSYDQQPYINELRKTCETFSSMNSLDTNEYYLYDDCKHDFYLSKIELKKKSLHNKLLKKVHNPSKLYFLIEDYEQGHYLHYFSSKDNQLRVFNIEREKWQIHISKQNNIPDYGATVYDYKSKRFYIVGGERSGRKSDSIIWYDKQNGWGQYKMKTAKSSCMVTLIDRGDKYCSLLVAGGINSRKQHINDCQIYHPKIQMLEEGEMGSQLYHNQNKFKDMGFQTEQLAPLNFAVSSGTLVTFNKTTVFKIGGLGNYNTQKSSLCEIAEKFDYGAYQKNKKEKWVYIELEVVNSEIEKKFKLFYSNQAAIQINPNEIFVFGGWSHDDPSAKQSGSRESYIIEVQTILNANNRKSTRYYVRWINQKPLISGQGFSNLKPIIYKKRIMSLQNISQGGNKILEKEKKLIEFNMFEWFETENIVNF